MFDRDGTGYNICAVMSEGLNFYLVLALAMVVSAIYNVI